MQCGHVRADPRHRELLHVPWRVVLPCGLRRPAAVSRRLVLSVRLRRAGDVQHWQLLPAGLVVAAAVPVRLGVPGPRGDWSAVSAGLLHEHDYEHRVYSVHGVRRGHVHDGARQQHLSQLPRRVLLPVWRVESDCMPSGLLLPRRQRQPVGVFGRLLLPAERDVADLVSRRVVLPWAHDGADSLPAWHAGVGHAERRVLAVWRRAVRADAGHCELLHVSRRVLLPELGHGDAAAVSGRLLLPFGVGRAG